MVERLINRGLRLRESRLSQISQERYDIGIWAAGYEDRAGWMLRHQKQPKDVGHWYRIEFVENRDRHSAPRNLGLDFGTLLGGTPGKSHWDGYWKDLWSATLTAESAKKGGPLDVFVDYSSMPRAAYGTLLLLALRNCRPLVNSITLNYTPGDHAKGADGATSFNALRGLIGTEGNSRPGCATAYILGIGYDGKLAETLIEMLQATHFSCVLGQPGVWPDSVDRAVGANRYVLERAQQIRAAAAWSVVDALEVFEGIVQWYGTDHDITVIPMGPKAHTLAALLMCLADRRLAYRWPSGGRSEPVDVRAAADADPCCTTLLLQTEDPR